MAVVPLLPLTCEGTLDKGRPEAGSGLSSLARASSVPGEGHGSPLPCSRSPAVCTQAHPAGTPPAPSAVVRQFHGRRPFLDPSSGRRPPLGTPCRWSDARASGCRIPTALAARRRARAGPGLILASLHLSLCLLSDADCSFESSAPLKARPCVLQGNLSFSCVEPYTVPVFFNATSYLEVPGRPDQDLFSVSFQFRTWNPNGLLLFSHFADNLGNVEIDLTESKVGVRINVTQTKMSQIDISSGE